MDGSAVGPLLELHTPRLILRRWRDADREPFAAMNTDPVVMEHFPDLLSHAESDAFIDRIERSFETRGWSLCAIEVVNGAPFIGYF